MQPIAVLASLPQLERIHDLDIRDQARATLRLVLDGTSDMPPIDADPNLCPNCGGSATSLRTPYCSECCREQSAFVRQVRHGLAVGTLLDPEKQVALGQKLWRLMGGGLPLRISLIPEKVYAKTLRRNDGVCEVCGIRPSVRIDNVGAG